jgi:type IV secretion system protein TrbJ
VKRIARATAISALLSLFSVASVQAMMPVIDATNLVQNILTALQTISQTEKQVEQYRTQLQQYENDLKNSTNPPGWIWDQAQNTISQLLNTMNALNAYQQQAGGINDYLNNFHGASDYVNDPNAYSDSGLSAMENSRIMASDSEKKADDDLFKATKSQQTSLQNDARTLKRLQTSCQSASGQMEAIQYANQFAGEQANQLLQIRALMIAQQNDIAAHNQAEAVREAQGIAADNVSRAGTIGQHSPSKGW